jgi:uncharacterized protein (DUF2147 family)
MAKIRFITWDALGRPVWDALAGPKTSPSGRPSDLTATGLWEQVDERTGKTHGWFRITEREGIYEGTIVRAFSMPDSPNTSGRSHSSEKNDGSFLGMTLIRGMRRNGNSYHGGTITDPRDGSVYSAQMQLSPDGQKLDVRGYLGIPLFGRSQIWNRLPDDALASEPPAWPGQS